MEKMPSASNSPVMGRKSSSNVESEGTENSKVKKVPLSVASMVRRFETTQNKTRGGGTVSNSVTAELMEQRSGGSGSDLIKAKESSVSLSSSSSPSSSQGHLNDNQIQAEVTDESATKTKTNPSKTVRLKFLYDFGDKLQFLPKDKKVVKIV